MDCECPIWIYGNTADGHVPRQSVGTTERTVAEAQRQALLKAEPEGVYGVRIDDAIERYIISREHEVNAPP